MKLLEADGVRLHESGGSLGAFDIIAIGSTHVRAIHVKAGTSRLTPAERRAVGAVVEPGSR